MTRHTFRSSLIKSFSLGALALMTATGFGARAAIPTGEPTDTATTATGGTDGNIQLACSWYQRRCVRTPTSVAGVRG